MDFDNIADNEDQLYRDILEEEQKKKSKVIDKSGKDYDDEGRIDYNE